MRNKLFCAECRDEIETCDECNCKFVVGDEIYCLGNHIHQDCISDKSSEVVLEDDE